MNEFQSADESQSAASEVENDDIAQLLRLLPREAPVPEEILGRAQAASREAWVETVAQRRRRGRFLGWGLGLAAGLLLAFGALQLLPRKESPPRPGVSTGGWVAEVDVIRGPEGGLFTQEGEVLDAGLAVRAGALIETDSETRAALRLAGGASLRLDTGTQVRLLDAENLELLAGGVYIDSEDPRGSGGLAVRTHLGIARDLGTQFEVRLTTDTLRVRVREGLVLVDDGDNHHETHPGAELTVEAQGRARHRVIDLHGPAWEWPLETAPEFELEGESLGNYLRWLERETGWRTRFEDPSLEPSKTAVILHGSLEGLRPDQTPELVLATCGLRSRLADGVLILSL